MKTLTTIALILFSIVLNAQKTETYTQTVRGTVFDKTSAMPLPGATVILLNTNPVIGTTTDADGEFTLENIPVGRISLQITFIGYEPAILKNLLLTSGSELVLNVALEEQVIVTDDIVVKAGQRKNETINKLATNSARSFSVEETERYAGSLGDPSRMAANFAGVSMVNDSRNDIVIRGNSPAGLLWRLDGVEIPNPNHFGAAGTTGGPVSILNNNLLTNSDFFTSAFPAQYGNAMSGVFDLKMRNGNNKKREYLGQIGFNGFELGMEGPFKKGKKASYLANYRYSTLDIMNKLGLDFGVGQAIPQYQDLTFKINLPGIKFGKLSMFGMGGLSYIELHDSEVAAANGKSDNNYNLGGVDLDFGSDMGVIGLSHLYFFNEKTRLSTHLAIQASRSKTYIDSLKFENDGSVIPNSNYPYYGSESKEIKYSVSTHLKTKFDAQNYGEIGFYYDLYHVTYLDSVKTNDPLFNGFKPNLNTSGNISVARVYAQWQHKFNNKLRLNTGVYSQYVDISKEQTFEPRLGIKYILSGKHTLSAGYGFHTQMQPRLYYFITSYLDDGSTVETNKNMKLSKSHQYVLAYDYLISNNFRFKAELYYQYLFDIPVSQSIPQFSILNTGDSFGGLFPDSLVNKGNGKNYGLELTLEKFLSNNFYFLSTLSIYQSFYTGYDKVERNTAFNNNYVYNILGGYEFNISKHASLSLDIKSTYAGGKPYVPIDLDASIESNQTEYIWDKAYDQKFDDYFRLDLRISFKLNSKKISQEWAMDLQNLTNHKNIYSQNYNARTKSIAYDYQTGFFPMMLYRIKF